MLVPTWARITRPMPSFQAKIAAACVRLSCTVAFDCKGAYTNNRILLISSSNKEFLECQRLDRWIPNPADCERDANWLAHLPLRRAGRRHRTRHLSPLPHHAGLSIGLTVKLRLALSSCILRSQHKSLHGFSVFDYTANLSQISLMGLHSKISTYLPSALSTRIASRYALDMSKFVEPPSPPL